MACAKFFMNCVSVCKQHRQKETFQSLHKNVALAFRNTKTAMIALSIIVVSASDFSDLKNIKSCEISLAFPEGHLNLTFFLSKINF